MQMRNVLSMILLAGLLGGCSTMPQAAGPTRPEADGTTHTQVSVTVVYADLDTINSVARERGHTSQANGFYDSLRAELWCPDEESQQAFRTCGHELRHVVMGRFHR